MKKKQRNAQLLLISIGHLLVLLTYFYYPYISKDKLPEDLFVQKDLEKTQHDDQLTTFESLEYDGLYDLNKSFLIKSEKAYIQDKEPDIVYMTNMHVILYLSDKRIVNIISDKGSYNKVTHDCFFEENVEATEGETKIFANNLDLLATENFAKAYNNVKLNNSMGSLIADKLEYDFEKKYFHVSNFDKESIKMKIIR